MKELIEILGQENRILPGEKIVADDFLNHRVDTALIDKIADEFYDYFKDKKPTSILTVETSGIVVAYELAKRFGCAMIFAKKGQAKNIGTDYYSASVYSYTKKNEYGMFVSKKFINPGDRMLLVDDFLANGQAAMGLIDICNQAKAEIVGLGIVVEKSWQRGASILNSMSIDLYSLAKILEIKDNKPIFGE